MVKYNDRNIKRDINRYKSNLIRKANTYGIYENFGQKEVTALLDKYPECKYSNKDGCKLILDFDQWVMHFDQRQLERETEGNSYAMEYPHHPSVEKTPDWLNAAIDSISNPHYLVLETVDGIPVRREYVSTEHEAREVESYFIDTQTRADSEYTILTKDEAEARGEW